MIRFTYKNNSIKEYNTFEDKINNELVIKIDLGNNNLKYLPENMNFPNLQSLICYHNKLTQLSEHMKFSNLLDLNCSNNKLRYLPETMYFPNLHYLDCKFNNLRHLPETMNFPNLQILNCDNNNLTHLPKNMYFPNLQILNCNNNNLSYLPENMNFPNLQTLNCSSNNITYLPENMNLPNLQKLYCYYNQLTHLPETMNFPYLYQLYCNSNHLTHLQEIMNFPNLHYLDCKFNNLRHLPETMNFPNLKILSCHYNQLTHLPENMNLPNLQELYCNNNLLTYLPDTMNLPNLKILSCHNNELSHLQLFLLNCHHLKYISYDNNPIELSPQIARFIKRIQNGSINKLNVYNDKENIHNSTIQLSVKDSINTITSRIDLPKYNLETLTTFILEDPYLECKEQFIEYCNDDSVHSLLLLSFAEVVWFTLQTIKKDFKIETQAEIKKILNQEMKDAECKCFTGRMNRVINCLNGFSPLVTIQIQDSEQIGNIIFIIKHTLETAGTYTVETHKELVIKEMTERGYTKDSIDIWSEYIE